MRRIATAVAVSMAMLLLAAPARADIACADDTSCSFLLTQTNQPLFDGIVVTVTIDNTGDTTVLSFHLTDSPSLLNTPLGIDIVAWNTLFTQVSTDPAMYAGDPDFQSTSSTGFGGQQTFYDGNGPLTTNGEGKALGGFGHFNVKAYNTGGTGGVSSPITFTLGGLVTDFPDNRLSGIGNNIGYNEFIVHLRFSDNCSGYVGGVDGLNVRDALPHGCTPVPEPGTLTLVATGLIGLVGVVRRRLAR